MRARFLGEDPDSQVDNSPTLFATDPQALVDIGPMPDHETLIEIPEDVLKMYVRRYQEEDR